MRARMLSAPKGGLLHTQRAMTIANGMTSESVGSRGERGPSPPNNPSRCRIASWTGSNVLKRYVEEWQRDVGGNECRPRPPIAPPQRERQDVRQHRRREHHPREVAQFPRRPMLPAIGS